MIENAWIGSRFSSLLCLLPNCEKFNDQCNSSNISKMVTNFNLCECHSHVSEAITLYLLDRVTPNLASRQIGYNGPFRDFDLCVTLTSGDGAYTIQYVDLRRMGCKNEEACMLSWYLIFFKPMGVWAHFSKSQRQPSPHLQVLGGQRNRYYADTS